MPTLDEFRAKYPALNQLNDTDATQRIAAAYEVDPNSLMKEWGVENLYDVGDLQRSVRNYPGQTRQIAGGIQQLGGEGLRRLMGDNAVSSYLINAGQDNVNKGAQSQYHKETDSFDKAAEQGLGAVLTDYAPYMFGQGLGNLAEMALTGGVGSLVGKQALKYGAKEALSRQVLKDAAELGGNIGLGAAAGFHGIGEVGGRAIEEQGLENVDFGTVLPAAAGHAGLEFIGDKLMGGALKGVEKPRYTFAKDGRAAIPYNMGKEVAMLGAKEAPVEIAQTSLERAGAGLELDSPEAMTEYLNSGVGAFAQSGPAGAVGGVRSSFRKEPETKPPFRQWTQHEALDDFAYTRTPPKNVVDGSDEELLAWDNSLNEQRRPAAEQFAKDVLADENAPEHVKQVASAFMEDGDVGSFAGAMEGARKQEKISEIVDKTAMKVGEIVGAVQSKLEGKTKRSLMDVQGFEEDPEDSAFRIALFARDDMNDVASRFNDDQQAKLAWSLRKYLEHGLKGETVVPDEFITLLGDKTATTLTKTLDSMRRDFGFEVTPAMTKALGSIATDVKGAMDARKKDEKIISENLTTEAMNTVKTTELADLATQMRDIALNPKPSEQISLKKKFGRNYEVVLQAFHTKYGKTQPKSLSLDKAADVEQESPSEKALQDADVSAEDLSEGQIKHIREQFGEMDEADKIDLTPNDISATRDKAGHEKGATAAHGRLEIINEKGVVVHRTSAQKIVEMMEKKTQRDETVVAAKDAQNDVVTKRNKFAAGLSGLINHFGGRVVYTDTAGKRHVGEDLPSDFPVFNYGEGNVVTYRDTPKDRRLDDKGDPLPSITTYGSQAKAEQAAAKRTAETKEPFVAHLLPHLGKWRVMSKKNEDRLSGYTKTTQYEDVLAAPDLDALRALYAETTDQDTRELILNEVESRATTDQNATEDPVARFLPSENDVRIENPETREAIQPKQGVKSATERVSFIRTQLDSVKAQVKTVRETVADVQRLISKNGLTAPLRNRLAKAQTEMDTLTAKRDKLVTEGRAAQSTLDAMSKEPTIIKEIEVAPAESNNPPPAVTTNASGKPIHSTVEGIRNFWRWFDGVGRKGLETTTVLGKDGRGVDRTGVGNSSRFVLDETRRPRVFFHGTKDDIRAFNTSHPNRKDKGWLGRGVYLTNASDLAETYADLKKGDEGATVMPLYAAVKNPLVVPVELKERLSKASQAKIDEWTEKVKAAGHDGVAVEFKDGTVELVAFDPEQVKSAVGNRGDFSQFTADTVRSKANLGGKPLTPEKIAEVKDYVTRVLGPKIKVAFEKMKFAGEYNPDTGIKIATTAFDPMGTAHHEALHAFFKMLRDGGQTEVVAVLEQLANNGIVRRQLERLLSEHSGALKQLSDPEEFASYAYQFWAAGKLTLGPKTISLFQKLKNFIKKTLGYVSEADQAEMILAAFHNGQASNGDVSAFGQVLRTMQSSNEAYNAKMAAFSPALAKATAFFASVEGRLWETKNPALKALAEQFVAPEGTTGKQGFNQAKIQKKDQMHSALKRALEKAYGGTMPSDDELKADVDLALTAMQKGVRAKDPVARKIQNALQGKDGFFAKMFKYIDDSGIKVYDDAAGAWTNVGHVENYFPRVWDSDLIRERSKEFQELLIKHHTPDLERIAKEAGVDIETVALAIAGRLSSNGGHADLGEGQSDLGFAPFMQAVNKRQLTFLDMKVFHEFQSKNFANIMSSYINQTVNRGEYVKRFGLQGERINELMRDAELWEATQVFGEEVVTKARDDAKKNKSAWQDELKAVDEKKFKTFFKTHESHVNAIMALEGTLGHDANEGFKSAQSYINAYENVRLLVPSIFTNMIDPLGVIIRGGDVNDAFKTMVTGWKGAIAQWKGTDLEGDAKTAHQLAEFVGTIDANHVISSLGELYNSGYQASGAKKINDTLFRWNGMEAFNRGVRASATVAAKKFIEHHAASPNEHSERYFDELYQKGGKPTLNEDGTLKLDDDANRVALMRWVDGAILRPTAATRPTWGSDPRYQIFFHMKNYTYAMHRVTLQRAWLEFKHGNTTPVLTLAAGYIPVMIASDLMKAMVINLGDEPDWMKGMGPGEVLMNGVQRVGLLGIRQFGVDALDDGVGVAGPLFSQLYDAFEDPAGTTLAKAMPAENVLRGVANGVTPG
jgi:hypothetical protein